jgi:Zn-dependent protease with chaperone function
MSRDEFDSLVKRLEPFAAQRPKAYSACVVLLAALGYAFWFVILGGLLGVLAGLVWLVVRVPGSGTIKIAFLFGLVVLFMFGAILRSLRVHIEPPEGFEVHRSQSPALFALLDDLSARLRGPRFHHVQLTLDYNAAVVQVPRLGALGWQKNFLILGLPLMQGLTTEQFRATMAHEFAHLSGNHSRFACWIYRVRKSWEQVLTRMQAENHLGTGLFLKFFQWYAPYFNAYTFVLARANEYEADRWAAQLAGVEVTAQMLTQVRLHIRLMEESFWPELTRLATRQAVAESGMFARLEKLLQQGPEPASAQRWVSQALATDTTNADTHPCLRDRLQAIGYLKGDAAEQELSLSIPDPAATPAARLLGDTLPACIRAIEMRWENATKAQWKERYLKAERDRDRLKELREEETQRPLSTDELCERARITLDLDGEAPAAPLLRQVLAHEPDHAYANFLLGRLLIEQDDEAGLGLLEKAIERDPEAVQPGLELLYRFYGRAGRRECIRALEKRYDEHQDTLRLAQAERQTVRPNDTFLPHGLAEMQLELIRRQLQGHGEILRAYLVRKEVTLFRAKPFFALMVESAGGWSAAEVSCADQGLVDRLAENLRLPGQTMIFTPQGHFEAVGRVIRMESWTLIYERARAVQQGPAGADAA